MHSEVLAKVVLGGKTLAAVGTLKWSFACVSSFMNLRERFFFVKIKTSYKILRCVIIKTQLVHLQMNVNKSRCLQFLKRWL